MNSYIINPTVTAPITTTMPSTMAQLITADQLHHMLTYMINKLAKCSIHTINGQPVLAELERVIRLSLFDTKTILEFFNKFSHILYNECLSPVQQVHYWLDDHRESLQCHLNALKKLSHSSASIGTSSISSSSDADADTADDESECDERQVIIRAMILLLSPNYPMNNVAETNNCSHVLNAIAGKHREWLASNSKLHFPLTQATVNGIDPAVAAFEEQEADYDSQDEFEDDCDYDQEEEDFELVQRDESSSLSSREFIAHPISPHSTFSVSAGSAFESTASRGLKRLRGSSSLDDGDRSLRSTCTTGEESNSNPKIHNLIDENNKRSKQHHNLQELAANNELLYQTSLASAAMDNMVQTIQAYHQSALNIGSVDKIRYEMMIEHVRSIHFLLLKMKDSVDEQHQQLHFQQQNAIDAASSVC